MHEESNTDGRSAAYLVLIPLVSIASAAIAALSGAGFFLTVAVLYVAGFATVLWVAWKGVRRHGRSQGKVIRPVAATAPKTAGSV